ncbi:YdcF family protein [Raoultibacter phocaeensis]|uniref:YdcF family protein n=1 Tax=Raoultibacter phocaeensis TaxID=2479841 RepID=UPI00111A26D1|nr:YdcF family protein [Raoultibacter phocaeensis]
MDALLLMCLVTAVSFAVFALVYRANKTNMLTGFTFGAFLFSLALTLGVVTVSHEDNPFFLYPLIAVAVLAVIAALFGLYILIAFLLFNARTVFKREGHSLANSLTLLAAVAIVVFVAVSWLVASQSTPFWVQALWSGIAAVVGVYTFIVFLFLMTAFLCSIARPRKNKDYIIVLGSGLIKGQVTPLLASRIRKAIVFAQKQDEKTGKLPILIMSGGQGPDEPRAEAEAMREFALNAGFDADHVLVENKSTDTAENMAFSKAIMDARSPEGYKAIYSTSNYHVMRAGIYARQAGLKMDGLGAKTAFYYLPNALLREFAALLIMRKRRYIITVAVVFLLSVATTGLPYYLAQMIANAV